MRQLNRRDLLVSLGSSGILALAGSYGGRTRPVFAQATCTLTPQQTEGPYWFDARQVRRDITEGKPGIPLRLLLRVVSASTCLPIPNALAEIWHCDAAGIYSGYSAQGTAGQTFLRGIQTSDPDGIVEFQTIYPGWYRGRTTHIHFKVHLGNQTLVTAQLYFAESISSTIYTRFRHTVREALRTPPTPGTVSIVTVATNSWSRCSQMVAATSAPSP